MKSIFSNLYSTLLHGIFLVILIDKTCASNTTLTTHKYILYK